MSEHTGGTLSAGDCLVKSNAGGIASPAAQFGDPSHALDPVARVVRLQFTKTEHRSLFIHSHVLRSWSTVLADLLDKTHMPMESCMCDGSSYAFLTIALDDTDAAVWEDALQLMHPLKNPFEVTWDNAERLMALAGKYDMPAVAGEDTGGGYSCSMGGTHTFALHGQRTEELEGRHEMNIIFRPSVVRQPPQRQKCSICCKGTLH